MRDEKEQFDLAGLKIVAVGQASPDELSAFLEGRRVPFETYCDPTASAYRAYGLERTSRWNVAFSPKVVAAGVKAGVQGHLVSGVIGDALQLPGSFVIKDGKVVFAHRGETSGDLASPDQLLAAASS